MDSSQIRQAFLDYFQKAGHEVVKSSSLIPFNDPTLLFTNAGMVQFKEVFLGGEKRDYNRATTSQKCVRAGGKHNDLDNVGHTARHHTFFEMLGNFSFGDYFKKEAIHYAWDFLTNVMGLPKDKLYVTVYETDDEAYNIWKEQENVREDRLYRLGEKDNFWAMGDTGPCGPCSEILIDQGEQLSCGSPDCKVGCDCDRYLEIWNLVFMQYNRDAEGKKTPLPKPSIDTGMGLERLTAVIQNVLSNYHSDLFADIINFVKGRLEGKEEYSDHDKVSLNVIADHSRAITFLIADGVLPSNEGRGYVLRRIIRRASRHAKMLGFDSPILFQVAGAVIDKMKDTYIELSEKRAYVANVVRHEEERFTETLDKGLKILQQEIDEIKSAGSKQLSGDVAFKLYDTYGFPLDLTADILRDEELVVDEDGFYKAMKEQKERSKNAWSGSGEDGILDIYKELSMRGVKNEFVGYDKINEDSVILSIIKNKSEHDFAGEKDEVEILTESTPFFGESGGQAGDAGVIKTDNVVIEISNTTKPIEGIHIHCGVIRSGSIKVGDTVSLEVNTTRRQDTARNHSATHLLQAALRKVLGDHINQAGSLVTNDRLRFDFTHIKAVSKRELDQIELTVNGWILNNIPVQVDNLSYKDAIKKGATALFNEKYGDKVRMVAMGNNSNVSLELCGGTHVRSTGDIGLLKIVSEGGIAAGVRRIEALTGRWAFKHLKAVEQKVDEISSLFKCSHDDVVEKTRKLIMTNKELTKKLDKMQAAIAKDNVSGIVDQAKEINGVKVLSIFIDNKEVKYLRDYADMLKDKLGSAVIMLASHHNGKVMMLAVVTKDLTTKYHAGKILKAVLEEFGGRGGGKPDMAQGGGIRKENVNDALEMVYSLI